MAARQRTGTDTHRSSAEAERYAVAGLAGADAHGLLRPAGDLHHLASSRRSHSLDATDSGA